MGIVRKAVERQVRKSVLRSFQDSSGRRAGLSPGVMLLGRATGRGNQVRLLDLAARLKNIAKP